MICKIVLVVITLFLILLLAISAIKSICSNLKNYFILFFKDMTLSDEDHKNIDDKLKKQYKESSLWEILNPKIDTDNENDGTKQDTNLKENIDLLLQIKDFYKSEINIFTNDYNEFLKKVDFIFKMYSAPIPIYIGIISYILTEKHNTEINYGLLIFAIILYLYYFIRVVWIQSLKNGFSKVPVEFPFLIKNISLKKYLESYIMNSAVYLKIQRENLIRLKRKIQYIHAEYIASSIFLILVIIIMYITK